VTQSPEGGAPLTPTGTMTRQEAVLLVRRLFTQAGLDTPALEARWLVEAALRISAGELAASPECVLGPDNAYRLDALLRRRLSREPLARILGEQEFWGLRFALSPETLVPRPDTETIVETALELLPDAAAPLRVLDLGTGSGCLLVALLHERPAAMGLGIDRSEGALQTAHGNAVRNNVAPRALFLRGNWSDAVRGPFDLVVSNPPYIPTGVIPTLDEEVRDHDPAAALDGGPDGLSAYRSILATARDFLAPEGLLVLEIGFDQAEAVTALSRAAGLAIRKVAHDLSGIRRCLALKWA
jgi:release factor glutamine methyltransferase